MEDIIPNIQETLNLIIEQNKKITNQISANETLIKMVLVDNLMNESVPLINENVLCNCNGSIDLDKTILEKYMIKEYNIT